MRNLTKIVIVGLVCGFLSGVAYSQTVPQQPQTPSQQAAQSLANSKVAMDVAYQTFWERINALYQQDQKDQAAVAGVADRFASCFKDEKCMQTLKGCENTEDCTKKLPADSKTAVKP